MKAPTLGQITKWSAEERLRVRELAAAMGTPIGDETVALIDRSGLSMRTDGGMSLDHPIYREMEEVIWSAEGKAAAPEAVKAGLSAIAKVDPLVQSRIGGQL